MPHRKQSGSVLSAFLVVSYLTSLSSAILIWSIPRIWVFADLTRVNNTVESGHYLDRCADWWTKLGELVHTSHSQDGVW